MAEPDFSGGDVGPDLGLRQFTLLSTGEMFAPSQYYRFTQKKRRRLARQLSQKRLGRHTREKAPLRLARMDEKITNQAGRTRKSTLLKGCRSPSQTGDNTHWPFKQLQSSEYRRCY